MVENTWADFVTGYLVNSVQGKKTLSNCCEHGAIVGADGTLWAGTSGFNLNRSSKVRCSNEEGDDQYITIDEFANLAEVLNGNLSVDKKGGVHIMGKKYVAIDSFPVLDVCKVQIFKSENGGAAVGKTSQGNYVIATFSINNTLEVTEGGKTEQKKQVGGFLNNAVTNLVTVLHQSGL